MPDITMCLGNSCPIKEQCYRYRAIPDKHRQSYFTGPPYDRETGECKYFVQIEKTDRLVEKEDDGD